jgi:hypothetical protein
VLLELAPVEKNPPSPFKLNPEWVKEKDYLKPIKNTWIPYDVSYSDSTAQQFMKNLKRAKQASIDWSNSKKARDERLLREVEDKLEILHFSEGFGFLTEETKAEVNSLEAKKRTLLLEKNKLGG